MKKLYRKSLRNHLFEEVQLQAKVERISKDGFCLLKKVCIRCSDELINLDHMWIETKDISKEDVDKYVEITGSVEYYLKKNCSYSYNVKPKTIQKGGIWRNYSR